MQLMDNSFSMVIQHWGTVVLSVKRIRFDLFFISLSYKKSLICPIQDEISQNIKKSW